MAGHSKWANIKFRKAGQDAKRSKLFTKFIREITVSAKLGGPDPESNPRLRTAIDKALGGNMPRDTINRAIKRGAGDADGQDLEEVRYEGYAPGGVAIIVDCLTDNRNRTVSEVRHVLTKHGGNLGTDGSCSYLFNKVGQFFFTPTADEETIFALALEADALDVIADSDGIEVRVAPDDFNKFKEVLHTANIECPNSDIAYVADTLVPVVGDSATKVLTMIEKLEDLDDTQNVYFNAEIPDDVLADF